MELAPPAQPAVSSANEALPADAAQPLDGSSLPTVTASSSDAPGSSQTNPCAGEALPASSTTNTISSSADLATPAPSNPPLPLPSSLSVHDDLSASLSTEALLSLPPPAALPPVNASWAATEAFRGRAVVAAARNRLACLQVHGHRNPPPPFSLFLFNLFRACALISTRWLGLLLLECLASNFNFISPRIIL